MYPKDHLYVDLRPITSIMVFFGTRVSSSACPSCLHLSVEQPIDLPAVSFSAIPVLPTSEVSSRISLLTQTFEGFVLFSALNNLYQLSRTYLYLQRSMLQI